MRQQRMSSPALTATVIQFPLPVHISEWFQETGLHTLYMSDCSNGESGHGAVKRLEQSRNLEVRRNRGSQRELNALESTIANFNWSNEVILTGNDEAAMEINEVTEQASLVSQATETIQPFSHDVSFITISSNIHLIISYIKRTLVLTSLRS